MAESDKELQESEEDYIQFQIVEWVDLDNKGKYTVLIFGRDAQGKSITLQVDNYLPFYYIKPKKQNQMKEIEKMLKKNQTCENNKKRSKKKKSEEETQGEGKKIEEQTEKLFEFTVEKKKNFYYFNNNIEEEYFKIVVKTSKNKNKSQEKIVEYNDKQKKRETGKEVQFYEINERPFIRLIHQKNINPAGWIKIQKDKLRKLRSTDVKTSTEETYALRSYEDIENSERIEIAPLKISAFDLECRPIKGKGFPKASKGYTIGQDLYEEHFMNMYTNNFDKVGWYIVRKLQEHQNYEISTLQGYESRTSEDVYLESVRQEMNRIKKKYYAHKKKYKCADDFKKVELKEETIQDLSRLFIKYNYWSKNFQGDPMIQIGLTTSIQGQDIEDTEKCIFTLKPCKIKDKEEGKMIDIRVCQTEREMIEKFCEEINKIDPDIITGYNTSGFDNQYLYLRAKELGKTTVLKKLSRLWQLDWRDDEQSEEKQYKFQIYKVSKLSSSALGKNDLKYIQTYGRLQMDLYKKIQRDEKLESYKLNDVAKKIIGESKDDIKVDQIFDYFERGNQYEVGLIAKYCIQDCVLCNKIILKKDIVTKEIAMANVCSVPLSYIFHRGQGVKIYSLVLKQTALRGYVIEDRKKQIEESQIKKLQNQKRKEKEKKKKASEKEVQDQIDQDQDTDSEEEYLGEEEEETYSGATVLEPKTGIYSNQMISVFDYASLYPSSMIEYNVSHDTLIKNGEKLELSEDCYTVPVNVNFTGEENQGSEQKKQETYRFVKAEIQQGIIPQILQNLLQQRKNVKKQMGKEQDLFKYKILDSQQLAYKITANSIYGQCGASTSQISLSPLAKVTTAVGRQMLQKAINFFQDVYKSQVIYGDTDSVFCVLNEAVYADKIDPNAENKVQAKLKALFEKGKEIEEEFQKLISDKQKLEFEKILYPIILFAKKRYYGYQYENERKSKLITTGTIATRRDSCEITKLIYKETLKKLMQTQENGIDDIYMESIKNIQDHMRRIQEGEYPKSYFKLSRIYKGDNEYKSDNLPHVQVVRKMQAEGKIVEPSERIEYYIGRKDVDQNKKLAQYQKAVSLENLEKMEEDGSGGIDYVNYIEKQIKNPLIQIYSLNIEKLIQKMPQNYITLEKYQEIKDKVKTEKHNNKNLSENEIQEKIADRITNIKEQIAKMLIFNSVVKDLNQPGMSEFKRIQKKQFTQDNVDDKKSKSEKKTESQKTIKSQSLEQQKKPRRQCIKRQET